MIFQQIIEYSKSFIESNLPVSIAIGFVFLLFMLKKPKYFMIVVLVLVAGLSVFELFQKLAIKTGLGGF
ncbi:MAG: hypothetical protein AMK71_07815 [Nitrospira bacterium SG8_35_4]|nr:MAG: hypothetical protein AMK71_07815 [Nitrospira bacterium SG8_35_4]